jgi:transmembrane sensor
VSRKIKYDDKREIGSSGDLNGVNFDILIKSLSIPSGKSKEQVWQAILEKLDEQPKAKIIPLAKIALRVAASLLIIIAAGSIWIWGYGEMTVYSPKGQHITQLLPDSSRVQMNADTRISYNKVLWFISRKVYINGEALFKVKKVKRFDVIADLATTTVLGTTFDVYARNGKVKVSCIEGRVSVKNNKSEDKVILTAGLNTQTKHNKLTSPIETIKHDETAWTFGEFYFNNTPLNEVIREIERQFNVEISYNETEKKFYTGYTGYFNNKDLNDALRLVCIPMEMSYSVNGKSIEIKQIVRK